MGSKVKKITQKPLLIIENPKQFLTLLPKNIYFLVFPEQ